MANRLVTRSWISALLGAGICLTPNYSYGETQEAAGECSQEILLAYFPSVFVRETMNRFNVPKDQWDAIVTELAAKDKEIIKTVEAKAAKMSVNPLNDPQQRQEAVKLFRETLLEAFSSVMQAHGINDEQQIRSMLDDIQKQKAQRFAKCMREQKLPPTSAQMKAQADASKKDSDKAELDDDDDE